MTYLLRKGTKQTKDPEMTTSYLPAIEFAANDDGSSADVADLATRSLLRFITCGSVDDGKSTLIGRLLHETGSVFDDQMAALVTESRKFGTTGPEPDYALLVDGLSAEREQGITIDVAYRYFSTPRRAFIVADTPGHVQYTRNMATGASTADLAIILIDASKGVLPQTRRHSFIVSLVGVRHVIVAVNKMDLVGFDQQVFEAITADYRALAASLGFASITFLPVAARIGDNVTRRSTAMAWHHGPTLLEALERADVDLSSASETGFVLPVQWVNRPHSEFRGFAGTLAAGRVRPGDNVTVLPAGTTARIARIVTFDGDLGEAQTDQSVTVTLDREIDVSRGDVLVATGQPSAIKATDRLKVSLLVIGDAAIAEGDVFSIRLGTATATARLARIHHCVDIETFQSLPGSEIASNGLARAELQIDRAIAVATYAENRALGALVLIDRITNQSVAMGVVLADEPSDPAINHIRRTRVVATRSMVRSALNRMLGGEWRERLGPAVSWRFGMAACFGLGIYLVTSNGLLAAGVALSDAALRPVLWRGHAALWRWWRARTLRGLNLDGGGI
jgi:bifunctional enzyme CysN/CysC